MKTRTEFQIALERAREKKAKLAAAAQGEKRRKEEELAKKAADDRELIKRANDAFERTLESNGDFRSFITKIFDDRQFSYLYRYDSKSGLIIFGSGEVVKEGRSVIVISRQSQEELSRIASFMKRSCPVAKMALEVAIIRHESALGYVLNGSEELSEETARELEHMISSPQEILFQAALCLDREPQNEPY